MLDVFNLYSLITVLLTFGAFHVLARVVYEMSHFDLIYTIPGLPLQFLVLFVVVDLKKNECLDFYSVSFCSCR